MNTKKSPKKGIGRRVRKVIFCLLLAGVLVGAGYVFLLPSLRAEVTTTYDKYTTTRGSISNTLSFSGTIGVKNSEALSASSAATVRQIFVAEEQSVAEGQKLMRLSNGETLKASFDGRVNQINVAVGDSVSSGDTLIQVVDFDNMKVSLRVDEYGISDVYVGQECTVTVTALSLSFDSQITHINRIASSTGNTAYYTVTAELAVTGSVLPGMQVTVTMTQEEAQDAVILNRNALSFDQANSAYVYRQAEDGTMTQTYVEIGVDNDNYVEIVNGLGEGEAVYVVAKTSKDASGANWISSLLGGSSNEGSTGMSGGNMPNMPSMPSGNPGFGGSGFGGGRER